MKVLSKRVSKHDTNCGGYILTREDGVETELWRWPAGWQLQVDPDKRYPSKRAAIERFSCYGVASGIKL